MPIALTKLADIAARSLFALLVLYSLPVRETGQFGLTLTLLGLYAFGVGFERYSDLQRRMVTVGTGDGDRLIVSGLRFFALNHLIGMPVLALLLALWVDLPPALVLTTLLVAVSEHLCNEVYRIALIAPRYRMMLFAVLVKNLVLLAWVGALWWRNAGSLQIDAVLVAWAACSSAGLVLIAIGYTRLWSFDSWADLKGADINLRQQYRASRTHFLIGLVAMATLQLDRLMAGGLLSLDQSGQYFRHAFLASFSYQVFNVASYNRLAPTIYADCQSGRPARARSAIQREYRWLVPVALVLVTGIYIAIQFGAGAMPNTGTVNPNLLALLTAGYFVRTMADFNALQLNAVYAERQVFRAQVATLASTLMLNLALTPLLGIAGPMVSLGLTAIVYTLATRHFVQRHPSLNPILPQ